MNNSKYSYVFDLSERTKVRRRSLNLALISVLASLGALPRTLPAQSYGVPVRPLSKEEQDDQSFLELSSEERVAQVKDAEFRLSSRGAAWATVSNPIRFANGSSELTQRETMRLGEFANDLKTRLRETRLAIEGHANRTGSPKLNRLLTQKRAENVRSVLVGQYGIEPSRLVAIGFGFEKPNTLYDPEDPRQRRAELRVLSR